MSAYCQTCHNVFPIREAGDCPPRKILKANGWIELAGYIYCPKDALQALADAIDAHNHLTEHESD